MALRTPSLLVVAALLAVAALAPCAHALPPAPFGLTVPETGLFSYWNYTVDIAEIQRNTAKGQFAEAATIYFDGKNNVRNATSLRRLVDFVARNLSTDGPDSWWAIQSAYHGSTQYLKDLIEPPLNGSAGIVCCGVRDASLRVLWRLWQMSYAQHEVDVGVYVNRPIEPVDGFAVLASPISRVESFWMWAERNSKLACIPAVKDSKVDGVGTYGNWAPTNLAFRNAAAAMSVAITNGEMEVAATLREEVRKTALIQFLQSVMVYAKRAVQPGAGKRDPCYASCRLQGQQAGAKAAWVAAAPLAGALPEQQAAIDGALSSDQKGAKAALDTLRTTLAAVASAKGIKFAQQVYACA